MSGFRVTDNTAGMESSANTMSVVSMTTRATSSGVATNRPPVASPEVVPVQDRADAHHSSDPGIAHITRLFDDLTLTFRAEQQAPGGEQDEGGKWIGDPLKALDEREPGADRQPPEHESACDAKQEHAALILGGNVELGENDDEDEDVVDRQGFLEEVRGEILGRGASAVSGSDPEPYRKS